MKKLTVLLALFLTSILLTRCDYLDIVPEGTPTIDHAFADRTRGFEALVTCYRYLPDPTDAWTYPAYLSNEYVWNPLEQYDTGFNGQEMTLIQRGRQKSSSPYLDFWSGGGGARSTSLFKGIRYCNIFLENVDKPHDLKAGEKAQWIAEAKFLKAYYHFFLMQIYGAIPLIKENMPVDVSPEDVKVYREPFDDCVDYIVGLLDEAIPDLPPTVGNETSEMGRITAPIAMALKVKVLALAASDLFNGNPDYAMLADNRGRHLYAAQKDEGKWQRVVVAAKEAIRFAETSGGIKLYEYSSATQMPQQLKQLLTLRGVVTDSWNEEIIWGTTKRFESNNKGLYKTNAGPLWDVARQSMPSLYAYDKQCFLSECGVPMHIADLFYTKKGLPMENDPDWIGKDRNALVTIGYEDRYIMKEGEQTAFLNVGREPRYYADLAFDSAIFQQEVTEVPGDPEHPRHPTVQGLAGQISGYNSYRGVNPTGYWAKKLVSYGTSGSYKGDHAVYVSESYALPLIRLADLYLLLSEALNESRPAPDDSVYYYIDHIRARAGLPGVIEAWNTSNAPEKARTKDGMREIIHRERMIELMFEGQMYYDLIRWKADAYVYLNKPIQGWMIYGKTKETYYVPTTMYPSRKFSVKDYLWPISDYEFTINNNLVQNPGW